MSRDSSIQEKAMKFSTFLGKILVHVLKGKVKKKRKEAKYQFKEKGWSPRKLDVSDLQISQNIYLSSRSSERSSEDSVASSNSGEEENL